MMRLRATTWLLPAVLGGACALAAHAATHAVAPAGTDSTSSAPRSRTECDYGISLALGGSVAPAESVFISLLSHSPHDPRALNNLGNLALMKGEPLAALSLYERAIAIDSADAGIRLNRATALLLSGDEEGAERAAGEGVSKAGGVRSASALLGIVTAEPESTEAGKGEKRNYLSKDEVLALLQAAATQVPPDSLRRSTRPPAAQKRRAPSWRSAGPRGGAADPTATLVYWKR